MQKTAYWRTIGVICRIGSLEILTGKAPTKELVICRIGSLETVVPLNMR